MPQFKEKYRVGKDIIFFIPSSAKLRSLFEKNFHCDLEFIEYISIRGPAISWYTHTQKKTVGLAQSKPEHFVNGVWLLGLDREINHGMLSI